MEKRSIGWLACALACAGAQATTWNWTPTTTSGTAYLWNEASNWTSADDTSVHQIPGYGDTALVGVNKHSNSKTPYSVGNDLNKALAAITVGPYITGSSQGNWVLRAGWGEAAGRFTYTSTKNSDANWNGVYLVGEGEVIFDIQNSVNYSLQMRFQKRTSTQHPTANPILVKTGAGRLICFNQSGSVVYDIPLTLIRQGAIDISTTAALSGCCIAFDGNDESQRLEFCYASYTTDITLKNGALFETNGVANTAHGISANQDRQVVFTGTPRMNPMVFSGQFYKKAGLKWSPASADYTFVCSNAVSETQGSVIVAKGTVRLVTGASFTALGTLDVAAGATFRVDQGAGADFSVQNLALAHSGTTYPVLNLGEGVSLAVNAATLDGIALAPGTYRAVAGEGAKAAAWITGAGEVVVATGPENSETWSGAAASTDLSEGGNWSQQTVPDLASGKLLATFATGGTAANLPAGTTAKFDGLVLAKPDAGTSFAFTAGTGGAAEIGASGFLASDAAAAFTWNLGWPLSFDAEQTWSAGANNTLRFTAPLAGTNAVTLTGSGTFELAADSPDLTGPMLLEKGTVRVTSGGALGAASRTVKLYYDQAKLRFAGDLDVTTPLYGVWALSDSYTGGITVEENAHVRFCQPVTMKYRSLLTVGAGAVATFTNGYSATVNGMAAHCNLAGNGTVVVTNKAFSCAHQFQASGKGTLDLRTTGNVLNSASYWAEINEARLVTRVANAIGAWNTWIYLKAGGCFDLDGHDQAIDLLGGSGCVTSAAPATLTLRCCSTGNNDKDGTGRVTSTAFKGQVSLVKNGNYALTLAADSTSTGSVKVTAGTLTLTSAASWSNATDVVVSGGTLKLANATPFGDKTPWHVASSASVNLAFAGTNHVDRLFIDGGRAPGGFYAASDFAGAADFRPAWLAGTGCLFVRTYGTALIVR